MVVESTMKEAIETRLGPVSADRIEAFRHSVRAQYEVEMPLTYPTLYRFGEFEWIKRLGIDLKFLLHADQEYEYRVPLKAGDDPVIRTYLKNLKSHSGMTFVTLESEILVDDIVCILARTIFVVRDKMEGP